MQITGGIARGRVIACPDGLDVRPTASKIRQAFFNILRNKVEGARFLDICAGSGLMGLEALSRGAKELTSIEETGRMVAVIKGNLKQLGFEADVYQTDVRRVLSSLPKHNFDIAFADPPYKSQLPESILQGVARHELLDEGGVLAIEHARDLQLSQEAGSLVAYDRRDYGQTSITFYKSA